MDLSLAAISRFHRQSFRDRHYKQKASQGVEIRNVWYLIESKEGFAESTCVKRYCLYILYIYKSLIR